MTRAFSPELTVIGEALEADAGQYLKSVSRQLDDLCKVCALPKGPDWDRCYQCNLHLKAGPPLADRVGSLIYAVEPDTQAYLTVRNYKAPSPGPSLVQRMQQLLAVGLRGHVECLASVAEAAVSGWAVVPSRRNRSMLRDLVIDLARDPKQEVAISASGVPEQRKFNPAAWTAREIAVAKHHALVIDDSWVTGASTQSVASALKNAGFEQVSILTVARVLKTNHSDVKAFVDHQLPKLRFDWRLCPWTATGACP